MKFKDLEIGQEFSFTPFLTGLLVSVNVIWRKISARKYVEIYPFDRSITHEVGSIDIDVYVGNLNKGK